MRDQQQSGVVSIDQAPLVVGPKEELAVIVQRLRAHENGTADVRAKVKLEIAADLIRSAIFFYD